MAKRRPAANTYVAERFLPEYWNERLTVVAQDEVSRYKQPPVQTSLAEVFCLKHERQVRSDHTISYGNETYKLVSGYAGSLKGHRVTVHEYEDKSWRAFYGTILLSSELVRKEKRRWDRRPA